MINISMFKTIISLITVLLNLFTLSFMNLFNMWFMLEITSMSMISLMMINKSKKASINYFIMSFISSSIMIFSISLFQMSNSFKMNNWLMMYMIISLMLKMGMIPFHKWMINLSNNLNWWNMFMLLMFMKIIPIYMLNQIMNNMNLIIIYIMLINLIFSSLLPMNMNSLKKIMIYSSINQSILMMFMMFMNMNLFFMYYLIYIISSISLFMFLNIQNINNKNMMINSLFNKKNKFIYLMLVMIYNNFPPMFSFIMKWSILENLMNFNPLMTYMIMIIMISSLFMSWNYLNLSNLNFYLNNMNLNYKIKMNSMNKNFYLINFTLILLFSLFSFMIY